MSNIFPPNRNTVRILGGVDSVRLRSHWMFGVLAIPRLIFR